MGVKVTDIVEHNTGTAARRLDKTALAAALRQSRARTLALSDTCAAALGPALTVPSAPELNPPLWELGHIGWFADWWIARHPQRAHGLAADPDAPRLPARQSARGVDADALYDSSRVPHDTRWHLPLPDASATRADLAASLDQTLALLQDAADDDTGLYLFRLALLHEDMHAEAAVYMAQRLGFDPCDAITAAAATAAVHALPTELAVPATRLTLGHSGPGFAFDNELGAQTVELPAFRIDAQALSWAQFLPFVESGSYAQHRFWSDAGWAWRLAHAAQAPRDLRQHPDGHWEQRRWGRWQPLDLRAPACHLTHFEAQAWCAWAGRRLPTEAEWVAASAQAGFVWGQVWEWTASPFAPFPGFEPHPYRDYSQPWFDGRPVLKGASAATHPRLRHPQYRNYFPPERNDIFAGLRSVAL
ncbi:selenoneine synthase SenA [Hydrogenophaga sp.]|uniref:selenoneine synthase SenA n=1 Tax=Hydrogenophaga sp. TaxID=1904254 RepID=UPI00286DEE5C|nr:selenoneine synthase SenA [Hydrogenophaga sp.]